MRISTAAYMAITIGFARKTLRKVMVPPKPATTRYTREQLAKSLARLIADAWEGKGKVRIGKIEHNLGKEEIYGIKIDMAMPMSVDSITLKNRIEPASTTHRLKTGGFEETP